MSKRVDLLPPPSALEISWGGEEHRQFPRARVGMRVALWRGEGAERRFTATVHSADVSVGGAFLESTFFVPIGTVLRASFSPNEAEPPVQAEGVIVREERRGDRTGFAMRFTEFYDQTEVTLAKLFVAEQLRVFVSEYLGSIRARRIDDEVERVVDTIAAWELMRVSAPQDTWGLVRKAR